MALRLACAGSESQLLSQQLQPLSLPLICWLVHCWTCQQVWAPSVQQKGCNPSDSVHSMPSRNKNLNAYRSTREQQSAS
jgi:hypothetical protein